MGILKKTDPWVKEFRGVWRQEQKFLRKYDQAPENSLGQMLEDLAPQKLIETVHMAFVKAFGVVFEKGDAMIAKAGKQELRQEKFQLNQFAAQLREDKRSLRAFAKEADRAGRGNVWLSGAAGVGMGLFGVALPDVPLFTAVLLKCVYETGESFGFGHESEAERLYVLRVMEAALSWGDGLRRRGAELDAFAQTEIWPAGNDLERQVQATARRLSETLVGSKFLQNIPVVGALGGAEDALCMERVRRYAAIKYRKRFLIRRRIQAE